MEIKVCYLSAENNERFGTVSVGEKVNASGKSALWSNRSPATVDTVVIHYISAVNLYPDDPFKLEYLIDLFCTYKVSAHYLISREGEVMQLVPEDKKAWHAGGSIMPEPDNRQNVNEFSIGIELAATLTGGFAHEQYDALAALCLFLEKKYTQRFVYVGHDQISGARAVKLGLRNDIKTDPGPLFDWNHFTRLLDTGRT